MPKIKINRSTVEKLPRPDGEKPIYFFDTILPGFAVRVSPKGVKAFVVQGRARGRMHRRNLGRFPVVSPEEARERARAMLSKMAAGKAPDQNLERVKVSLALDEWLKVHVKPKLKPRTALDYETIAKKVLKPALGSRYVADVERADIAKLHGDRCATPRRSNYILAIARSFFSYLEDAGYRDRDSNPAKRIKAFPENRRERFLTREELGQAAAAITAAEVSGAISLHAAAALRLCILTGARQGEIRALKWREVDLERGLLLLEDSKTGRKTIYLNAPALGILKMLPRIKGNEFVIVGELKGEPYRNLTRAWIKVRKLAKLPDVRLHDLRHTFASVGASESLSLPIIGRLLGHSVPATTARYAHLAADPVREANERIGERLAEVMGEAQSPLKRLA